MEIRNALQKIENYLTVVSNLNKTILSEGTMSRDELLLMKKYLYTSIDRVEDIERSLIIDKREDKSFVPSQTVENKFIPKKEKEIVEVAENEHIDEMEAKLLDENIEEIQPLYTNLENEEMVFVGEINPIEEQTEKTPEKFEIEPLAENIITEDYSINKLTVNSEEDKLEVGNDTKSFVESIITEDYSINKLTENIEGEKMTMVNDTKSFVESIITEDYSINKLTESIKEDKAEMVNDSKSFVESIITEDYTLNRFFETQKEEDAAPVINEIPLAENIITEDYSINKLEEIKPAVREDIVAEQKPVVETLASKFEERIVTTFAEELENKKKEETSLFEHLEQKLNESQQSQLFEMFDDGLDEFHESFAKNTSFAEPGNVNAELSYSTAVYEQHDSVLVMEKEVETVVEKLTPSSLNEIFKPQVAVENLNNKTNKTLSESIALNDKFIFVRELFGNHFGEYEAGLKQLESQNSFEQAETYCKDRLWNKFNWNDKAAAAERFMSLLRNRFN